MQRTPGRAEQRIGPRPSGATISATETVTPGSAAKAPQRLLGWLVVAFCPRREVPVPVRRRRRHEIEHRQMFFKEAAPLGQLPFGMEFSRAKPHRSALCD